MAIIKDAPEMPRNLGFRSDIRTKIPLNNLMVLYGGLPSIESTKTAAMAQAVLKRLFEGARLAFPGHVLNAADYQLVQSCWCIQLPSRVPQWLYDNGLINAEGDLTIEGKQKARDAAELSH